MAATSNGKTRTNAQKKSSTTTMKEAQHSSRKTSVKKPTVLRPKLDGTMSSKEHFLTLPVNHEGWKCEWRNDKIELNETSLLSKDRSIINTLLRAFTRTTHFEEGWLYAESRCLLTTESKESIRVADLAYFTEKQSRSQKAGKYTAPTFVVEIVHKHDRRGKLRQKIAEYFANGVRCVWCIHADSERVRVYRSPQDSSLIRNNAVCSAAPALPDLTLSAKELFEFV